MLTVITGGRGSGKTTLCQQVASLARVDGREPAGILSPALVVQGQKIGIQALDLRSQELRLLARLRQAGQGDSFLQTRNWVFDESVMAWANLVLQDSVPCDILVVDELGTLELEAGRGWLAGLMAVSSGLYRQGLVVIRPELLEKAVIRWPEAVVLDASQAGARRRLLALLGLKEDGT